MANSRCCSHVEPRAFWLVNERGNQSRSKRKLQAELEIAVHRNMHPHELSQLGHAPESPGTETDVGHRNIRGLVAFEHVPVRLPEVGHFSSFWWMDDGRRPPVAREWRANLVSEFCHSSEVILGLKTTLAGRARRHRL